MAIHLSASQICIWDDLSARRKWVVRSAQIEDPKGDQTKIKKSVTKKKDDKKEESSESSSDSSDSNSSETTRSEVDSNCKETYESGGATDDYEDSEENAGDISQDKEVEDVEGNEEDGQEGELDL